MRATESGPRRRSRPRPSAGALALLVLLVARDAPGGVGIWTTGGPEGASVRALAIDPANPAIVYAGTGTGVFKSTDGARSWERALVGNGVTGIAIHPTTPAILYAAGGGTLSKSTNGGATWTALTPGDVAADRVIVDPTTPATVYVGGTHPVCGNYGGPIVVCIDHPAVAKSTNEGATWEVVGLHRQAPSCRGATWCGTVEALAIDPWNPTTLYLGTAFNGVFKSANGGVSWSPANTGLPDSVFLHDDGHPAQPKVRGLAIDPATPATLYVGTTRDGVYKSTDGGSNWHSASDGLTSPTAQALAVDPGNPATLFAGTPGGGVFKSTDGGAHWAAANLGLGDPEIQTLAAGPLAPAIV